MHRARDSGSVGTRHIQTTSLPPAPPEVAIGSDQICDGQREHFRSRGCQRLGDFCLRRWHRPSRWHDLERG